MNFRLRWSRLGFFFVLLAIASLFNNGRSQLRKTPLSYHFRALVYQSTTNRNLLSLMTLDEKIACLGTNPSVPRLGIKASGHVEGIHGLAREVLDTGVAQTQFQLRHFRKVLDWAKPGIRIF
jgi:hypothetical protein